MRTGLGLVLSLLSAFLAPGCEAAALNPGDRAPEFELVDLSSRTVSLFDILNQDKPVILSFFGTWCESCLKEITELPETIKPSGALVYLVGLDPEKAKLSRFAEEHSIKFPILWDPKARTLGRKYDLLRGNILITPRLFVISPSGTIEYSAEAYDKERKTALSEKLAQLKDKKWERAAELAVFFTGSINGRLQPAVTARKTGGGLIKLAPFLKQQAARYPNRLLLDSGDFLPYGASAAQAGLVMKAMALAGYDAIAVGDQDLHFDGFLDAADKKALPFLASNLTLKNGRSAGLPEKIVTAGGVKIRILSFASSEAFSFYPEEFSGQIGLTDLTEALKNGKGADLLILLSHAGIDENKKIAEKFRDIDLIIGGHSQELTAAPERAGNALIVQTGGNLEAVGKIVMRFDGAHRLLGNGLYESFETLALPDTLPDDQDLTVMLQDSKKQAKRADK